MIVAPIVVAFNDLQVALPGKEMPEGIRSSYIHKLWLALWLAHGLQKVEVILTERDRVLSGLQCRSVIALKYSSKYKAGSMFSPNG